MASLLVVGGPNLGQFVSVAGDHPIIIGRDKTAHLTLNDAKVFRKHLAVQFDPELSKFKVVDFPKRRIFGGKILKFDPFDLDDLDVIQIGDSSVVFTDETIRSASDFKSVWEHIDRAGKVHLDRLRAKGTPLIGAGLDVLSVVSPHINIPGVIRSTHIGKIIGGLGTKQAGGPGGSGRPTSKGFGFITPEVGGKDIFVHHTDVRIDGSETSKPGDRAGFEPPQEVKDTTAGQPGPSVEPPWIAFPLLKCDSAVVVQQPFDLEVGLAPEQQPGVEGEPLGLPHPKSGPYPVDIDVMADGFALDGGGIHKRLQVIVSVDDPYPTVTVKVIAVSAKNLLARRSIIATYSVYGLAIGNATRFVNVLAEGQSLPLPEEVRPVTGFDEARFSGGVKPDLTIRITQGNEIERGVLTWSIASPYGISLNPDPQDDNDKARKTSVGDRPQDFASDLWRDVENKSGRELFDHLYGTGLSRIGPKIPKWIVDRLRTIASQLDRLPTVLICSDEPYVPWDLAAFKESITNVKSPFLGAQVVLGRWIPGQDNQPPPLPPVELLVGGRAVIGCSHYEKIRFNALPEAEQEVKDLHGLGWISVDGLYEDVTGFIEGMPKTTVIHFALHGAFGDLMDGDGIVLVAREKEDPAKFRVAMLTGAQVSIWKLSASPFVFLNACQVGRAKRVLGDYGGFVNGFLFAGASAVIAPLWKINDGIARDVALRFYKGVFEDKIPPAELIRRERAKFDGEIVEDASYLAYQFFGHPSFMMREASP